MFLGAIDIDIYDLTLEQQMEIINAATEYKLVAAWSESKDFTYTANQVKEFLLKE